MFLFHCALIVPAPLLIPLKIFVLVTSFMHTIHHINENLEMTNNFSITTAAEFAYAFVFREVLKSTPLTDGSNLKRKSGTLL